MPVHPSHRMYVRHALEKFLIGKADEPVKYHKVSSTVVGRYSMCVNMVVIEMTN